MNRVDLILVYQQFTAKSSHTDNINDEERPIYDSNVNKQEQLQINGEKMRIFDIKTKQNDFTDGMKRSSSPKSPPPAPPQKVTKTQSIKRIDSLEAGLHIEANYSRNGKSIFRLYFAQCTLRMHAQSNY